MEKSERLFNVLLGFSILSWAAFGFLESLQSSESRPIVVRLSVVCLHVVVGLLVLTRDPIRKHGSIQAMLLAIPAVLIGGLAFVVTPSEWTVFAQACLLVGSAVAATSLYFLGKSFAILPAVRNIVSAGPYNVIRHPAYAGELLMVFGCVFVCPIKIGAPVFVLAVAVLVARILAEENLLRKDIEYASYCERVRWRLVPWVW